MSLLQPGTIRMVQSLNVPGILSVGRVLLRPSLLMPHIAVPHIGLLDFERLQRSGEIPIKMPETAS
jgi:hypothetical protein